MLISLDMSNRMIVSEIILKDDDFKEFQKIILTHDRGFFEILRSKTSSSDWEYLEFHKDEKRFDSSPKIRTNLSYLEKAERFIDDGEYEIAGNLLRKEAEQFCIDFLPMKYHYSNEHILHNLDGLITQCKKFATESALEQALFEKLDNHRKFVLNSSSHHSYDVPKFESEVRACYETLVKLRQIKFAPIFYRGHKIEFEMRTGVSIPPQKSGRYKFEIIIQDDFRLIKEGRADSIISKGMINFLIYKDDQLLLGKCKEDTSRNCKRDEYRHDRVSIQKFYENQYEKSDKKTHPCFWEGITISGTQKKLISLKEF